MLKGMQAPSTQVNSGHVAFLLPGGGAVLSEHERGNDRRTELQTSPWKRVCCVFGGLTTDRLILTAGAVWDAVAHL